MTGTPTSTFVSLPCDKCSSTASAKRINTPWSSAHGRWDGIPSASIHVSSADLGQSGQDSGRPGVQEVVAKVSLGHVGIVLAYEASRLARNTADW